MQPNDILRPVDLEVMFGESLGSIRQTKHLLALDAPALLPILWEHLGVPIGMLGNAPLLDENSQPYLGTMRYNMEHFAKIWSIPKNQEFARRTRYKDEYRNFVFVPLSKGDQIVEKYETLGMRYDGVDYGELLLWCMSSYQLGSWLCMPLNGERDGFLFLCRDTPTLYSVLSKIAMNNASSIVGYWGGPSMA